VRRHCAGRSGRFPLALFLGTTLLLSAVPCLCRELFRSEDTSLDLGATYKNLFIGSRFYEIPFVEDRTETTDFQRARLMLDLGLPQGLALEVHYQHRALLEGQ
jgi:hypothetical protein